jgi:hypothetical protein
MKNESVIKNFMTYLTILNVRFYSEFVGYIEVKIGEVIYEYDFEMDDYIGNIKKIINKTTQEEYDVEILFEKAYLLFPEIEKSEEIYNVIKYCFNEYFVYEIEIAINKGIAKKIKNDSLIEFQNFKKAGRYFNIYCSIFIFDKKLTLHFTKMTENFTLHINERYSGVNIDDWFWNEIKINKNNKLTSNFYVDHQANGEFYGLGGILGEMIIQEFKNTKYFQMNTLYDDELKILFK